MPVTQVYKTAKSVTDYVLICAGVAALIAAGPILNALGIIGG